MDLKVFARMFLGIGKTPRIEDKFAVERLSFGDRVRVVSCEATDAAGLSERVGDVYGMTTPSVTDVKVIGALDKDEAISVHFESGEDVWLPAALLELVDHGAGMEVQINGASQRWVRRVDGGWDELDVWSDPADSRH